jgi:hypothetical protein
VNQAPGGRIEDAPCIHNMVPRWGRGGPGQRGRTSHRQGETSALKAMGLSILKTPGPSERLGGTIRRECLDFVIPLTERHLRGILKGWVAHYNQGRPHSSLGPGIPEPRTNAIVTRLCGHRIPRHHRVHTKPILGGLHHEYRLESGGGVNMVIQRAPRSFLRRASLWRAELKARTALPPYIHKRSHARRRARES